MVSSRNHPMSLCLEKHLHLHRHAQAAMTGGGGTAAEVAIGTDCGAEIGPRWVGDVDSHDWLPRASTVTVNGHGIQLLVLWVDSEYFACLELTTRYSERRVMCFWEDFGRQRMNHQGPES